ncbi:MAG: choice-of-anchor Q domain-containing protein, partial [Luteolibacter sp.]
TVTVTVTAYEVTTLADTATPGSLRQTLADAAADPGADLIVFHPDLSGDTITLGTQILITDTAPVTIDASALSGGLTLSGGTSRHFTVQNGSTLALRNLTLTGGNNPGGVGGSILNLGTLDLLRCTFTGNAAAVGGAIHTTAGSLQAKFTTFSGNTAATGGGIYVNTGDVTLTSSTLSGNTAESAAAIFKGGPGQASMTNCTVAGNRGTSGNGAIVAFAGTLDIEFSTISQNAGNGAGGGLYYRSPATVSLYASIIAGNTDASSSLVGPDVYKGDPAATVFLSDRNFIGTLANSGIAPGPDVLVGDPKLSPLGHFGGPVQTMHPLIGSPAIDGSLDGTPVDATDARGFPGLVDGDTASPGAQYDLGAVEAGPLLTVMNNAASGDNSLRARVSQGALALTGARIGFSTAVFPAQTILLDGDTEIFIPATPGVFIDASNLSAPVTISGNHASRIFDISQGATVAMHSLRIVNGNVGVNFGGGIQNGGTCTVLSSTFAGNSAHFGGGIFNHGTCTVYFSTLGDNTAPSLGGLGGGIFNQGTCTLVSSTLSGNSAAAGGGGIMNFGTFAVLSSTLSGNSAADGGGIFINGTFHLASSIVADNVANNVVGSYTGSHNLIGGTPLLAPLGHYGGPTPTMPPLRGSPAIDAGAATTAQTDQRGFPRTRDGDGLGGATPDIGAVEASLIPVTTTLDSVSGSLRAALTEAATQPGADTVYFTPAVTTHLTLASEILITDPAGITLDATDRPTGLVIDGGPGTNRHFRIAAGTTAVFNRLRLYGGNGGGAEANDIGHGGSIRNEGTLTLRECMIADCTSPTFGGALYNANPGTLTLERSTLYGNSATSGGGAIQQVSPNLLTLTACTVANNRGGFEAGGINAPFGPASLIHSTVTGNAVVNPGSNGVGGLRGGALTVAHSIIAGNTDANFPGTPNISPGFTSEGTNLTTGDPKLAALGDYGGPTWTMPPMPGSFAIDAATFSTAATDQRGFPRPDDGDLDNIADRDLGAVEMPPPLTVQTAVDSPIGSDPQLSLREAVFDAAAGTTILFAPSFNGEPADTIVLDQALGEVAFTKGLIINASTNPGGVTIDGGLGTNRIFYLPPGTGASLHRLTLTGGGGGGVDDEGLGIGGAIYCDSATLALTECTLMNNATQFAGAILNSKGTLTLDRCLLAGNIAAQLGGAIYSNPVDLLQPATSSTTLRNCTLTNNIASGSGGAFYMRNGRASLLHCTITGNIASANQGSGIASRGDAPTLTTAQNCLIAGNSSASDVNFIVGPTNSFLSLGGNLIGTGNATGAFTQLRDFTGHTAASLRLAPLADYGGPTRTIALRPGSPARDNATPSPITTDQRGFPIVLGPKDSGSYEAGNFFFENFNVFAQEFLPPTAADLERAPTFDFDSDGTSNELEWLAFTGPTNPASVFRPTVRVDEPGFMVLVFPTVTGRTYTLQQSDTLAPDHWITPGLSIAGTGDLRSFRLPTTSPPRRFFRIGISQP